MSSFKITRFVDPTAKHSEIANNAIENFKKEELQSNTAGRKFNIDEVRTKWWPIVTNQKINK